MTRSRSNRAAFFFRPFLLALLAIPVGCREQGHAADEVVLYSSADPEVLAPLVEAFEKRTGIKVKAVGDTEATKTTGLVQRLIAEKEHPRADVWWSSEAMGTAQAAAAGVLTPHASEAAEGSIPGGWPKAQRGPDGLWYGFAQRTRAVVINPKKVAKDDIASADAMALIDPKFRGRVGIARPQFGTTRGHTASILVLEGEDALRRYAKGLRDNGVRLYEGNMSVVRGVAQGEIDIGLADSDDAWAGQRNGWPVEFVPACVAVGEARARRPLVTPNTVALVKSAPHPAAAAKLIDFLLSPESERLLAQSESHNIPVHPDVAKEFARYAVADAAEIDWAAAAAVGERALSIVEAELAR